jgi:hypothetical protein
MAPARILSSLLVLAVSSAVLATPAHALTSRWVTMKEADSYLAHLRRSGLFPVVSAVACLAQGNQAKLRFTYKYSKTMVTYKFAYSFESKDRYEAMERKYLTHSSPKYRCNSGNFFYGIQNVQ